MRRCCTHPVQSDNPGGFSLMELLIVLALLVVVAGIAAPAMMDRLADSQVHRAADSVREVLSEARTYAIDSGIDYQFRYEVNGQFFVVLPTETEPTLSNSVSTDTGSSDYMRLSGQLQDTLFLRAMKDDSESSDKLEAIWFGSLPDAGVLTQKSWSAPIYFRFDGSADDRTFRVMDESGRTSELSVRGLTGAVRMTPVYVSAEGDT